MEPGLRNGCVEFEETVAERAPSFQRLLGYAHTSTSRQRPTSVDLRPPSIVARPLPGLHTNVITISWAWRADGKEKKRVS